MDFQDLTVIWNAQKSAKLYAYDQAALEKRVIQHSARVKHQIDFVEIVLMFIMGACGLVTLAEPVLFGQDRYQLATGPMFLLVAVYLWTRWRSRQNMRVDFDRSLIGVLDQAIAQLDHHIRHVRAMVYWLGVPYLLMLGLSAAIGKNKPWWMWIMLLFALVLGLWVNHRGIQRGYLPRKRELEALRSKLSEWERA